MTDREQQIAHAQAEWIKATSPQEKRLWGKRLLEAVFEGNTPARDRDSGAGAASVAYRGVTTRMDTTTGVCNLAMGAE